MLKLFIILLNLSAAINFIIMTSVLMFRKNNTLANRSLAVIICIPIFSIITNLLIYLNEVQPYFFLLYFTFFISFLFGPIMLSYFRIMFGRKLKLNWKFLMHCIPSIISLFTMVYFFSLTLEEKNEMILNIQLGNDALYILFNTGILLQLFVYLFLGWKMQRQYYKEVSDFFTDIDTTKYNWVLNFLKLMILLTVIITSAYVFTGILCPPSYIIYADIITTPLVTTGTYLYVLYSAFDNRVIFTNVQYVKYENQLFEFNTYSECIQEVNKYGKSVLDETEKNDISERLTHFLKEEKIYLDKTLDLKSLSEKVGVSSHQLSQCINSVFNKSFYDLINSFRVEEAKKLLINSQFQNLKIEAIGNLAGFSSRTTFFTVFKKHVGLTPLGFLKKQTSTNA